ncbi:MAG: hypothetical protein LBT86_04735 [Deltaproteobacteria bacterium]|jgi:hypothetical protein|nr:hypothetical protein [Deltaproteobacteria bacterium]
MRLADLTPKRNFEGPDLRQRLDCFGEFNIHDRICFGGCALGLCCAIAKCHNFFGQFPEELARPELTTGWNDVV